MSATVPASHQHCPVGHAMALLGDRWSILVVREALAGVDRYQGFHHALGISDHTLTRRLGHLQTIGVLRRVDSDRGGSARYVLTDAGRDLARVLAVLGDWAMRWLDVESPLRSVPSAVIDAAIDLGLDPPPQPPDR